jgi:CheY-like chemotaxis protein
VKFTPVDLNQIARELATLLSETFPRSMAIHLNLFDALPPLLADQSQVHQIVLNFCVNARDAMPVGGTITLTTSTHTGASLARLGADPAHNYARLAVTDTGTGMTPEVRARIFEPFFTTKPVNQGTGLGLAVVYGIVTAHQGFLDVESAPGLGSTFSVYLPLAEANTAAPAAIAANEALAHGTESLLIVDDEDSLRELLSATFSRQGYRTVTAATGDEAIAVVQDLSRHFDAVLLDLNMPGAGGLEVLKVIKQVRPRAVAIVISGHITPDVRREFEHLGHRDFVQKPYRLDEIGRLLRTLLAARTAA